MPEQFHFLQPIWFLGLVPMALLLWWLPRASHNDSSWQRACESHLLPYLLNKPVQAFSQLPMLLLAAGWMLAVFALADPAWHKQPQPVYRSQDAAVVILDLSRSMLSSDLAPSRLERARYKVADILKRRDEGQTGLVVFAGDAFTVSPLTSDNSTIQSLLKPLHPDLMPVQGSRADLGIHQASELLRQAGISRGEILLVTDGYSDARALDLAAEMNREGYRLSVLGAGGEQPAPIPDGQGSFMRDNKGDLVMPALDNKQLQRLANAGGGNYSRLTANDNDLARVLVTQAPGLDTELEKSEQASDVWQSQGPWLVLVLLPLAALAFRRGWLLTLPLLVVTILFSLPQPAMASAWDDLWQRRDQQANKALQAGDLESARQLAEHPLRRGEAAYRAGDYENALTSFSDNKSPQGNYNRGNTLAQLGQYEEAIAAYDEALSVNPDMADAAHNKAELEKLLQQQQQQQQEQGENNQEQGESRQADENQTGDAAEDPTDSQQADNTSEQEQSDNDTDAEQQAQQSDGDQENASDSADQPVTSDQQHEAETPVDKTATADTQADTASSEQQQADERWLRRIPDDPGGLLRRKFLYQYSQRDAQQSGAARQAW